MNYYSGLRQNKISLRRLRMNQEKPLLKNWVSVENNGGVRKSRIRWKVLGCQVKITTISKDIIKEMGLASDEKGSQEDLNSTMIFISDHTIQFIFLL